MPKEKDLSLEMFDGEATLIVDDFDEDDTETMEFRNI
jgi:hypothetical protein